MRSTCRMRTLLNSWKVSCILVFFFLAVVSAVTGPGKVDASMCAKTDPLPVCVVKKSQCAPLDGLLAPLLGSPDVIKFCATAARVPLSPQYYGSVGKAVVTGDASSLGGKPTSDPVANLAIRRCILNATGMLGPDLSLDRGAVESQVSLLAPPALAASVTAAVTTCPEPVTYKTTSFIKCLKKACVASAPGLLQAPAAPAVPPAGYF